MPSRCAKPLDKRYIELGTEQLVRRGVEFLQGVLQDRDAAVSITSPDRHLAFKSPSDQKIWRERMGFGARDEPIDMLLGALQIASPKENRNAPDQRDAQCQRVVHGRRFIDRGVRLACRLIRTSLQPKVTCQYGTGQISALEAKIDRRGSSGTGPALHGSREFRSGLAEISVEVKRDSQDGMGESNGDRILDGSGGSGTAPCVVKGSREISDTQVEHVQRAEQTELIKCLATLLGDRKAPPQGCTCRCVSAAHEHQGHAEGGLKMHLIEAAARSVIEGENGPL